VYIHVRYFLDFAYHADLDLLKHSLRIDLSVDPTLVVCHTSFLDFDDVWINITDNLT